MKTGMQEVISTWKFPVLNQYTTIHLNFKESFKYFTFILKVCKIHHLLSLVGNIFVVKNFLMYFESLSLSQLALVLSLLTFLGEKTLIFKIIFRYKLN